MVRALGSASKESILQKIPYTVYSWLRTDIEKKVGKNAWYNALVAIMSQLLNHVSIFVSLQHVVVVLKICTLYL